MEKIIEIEFDVLYWISIQTEFAQSAYFVVTKLKKNIQERKRKKKKHTISSRQSTSMLSSAAPIWWSNRTTFILKRRCVFVFMLLYNPVVSMLYSISVTSGEEFPKACAVKWPSAELFHLMFICSYDILDENLTCQVEMSDSPATSVHLRAPRCGGVCESGVGAEGAGLGNRSSH